jgi:HEAT repeat protein
VDPLIKALQDPNKRVREEAALALGLLRDPRAITPLNQTLRDPDEAVRKRAVLALLMLGEQKEDSHLT